MPNYEHQTKIINDDPLWKGLWLGCGSGKTRIALNLAEGDTLVICEKQQREDKTWENELAEIGIELQLTVISKEDFRLNKFEYRKYDTVILDEATWAMGVRSQERQKSNVKYVDTSKVFLKMKDFLDDIKPKRFYPVTATLTKTPLTVFSAGVLLNRISFSKYHEFRDKFYIKLPMGGWTDIYSVKNYNGIEDDIAVIVNKLGYTGSLSDWNDVPDQTYITKKVALTTDQKRHLKDIVLDYPEQNTQNCKRHQVENGILIGDEYSPDVFIDDNKIEAIKDYALQFDTMIVVAKWTKHIEKLQKELSTGYPHVHVLNGKTKNRSELMKSLREKDKYILIVQAGISKGWELPKCESVIFVSNDYKWEDYNQIQGRVQRANNIKKNVYINIVTEYPKSMDNRVLKRLEQGDDFNDAL